MREESKALRERRAKARKEREMLAVRKPDNRKAQLEMDRRRTEKLILKQEMYMRCKERERSFCCRAAQATKSDQ